MPEFGPPSFETRPEMEPRPPDPPPRHNPVEDLGRLALASAEELPPPERDPRLTAELGKTALSAVDTAIELPPPESTARPGEDIRDPAVPKRVDNALELSPEQDDSSLEAPKLGASVDDTMAGSGPIDVGDEDAVRRARAEAGNRIDTIEHEYEFVIGGDPSQRLDDWHPQGLNDYGFKGTCGIACVQELGRQMGQEISENQLTHTAVDRGLCETESPDPAENGAIKVETQQELLSSLGLESQLMVGQKAESLAQLVEDGHGVLAYVPAQYIVDGPDLERIAAMAGFEPQRGTENDHSVHVTGTVRSPETRDLIGFIINDPTDKPGQTVDIDVMTHGWEETGGQLLVVRRQ